MDEQNYIQIYYMNDEQKPITVQINHEFRFDPNNPHKEPMVEYIILQPCEARLFKIEAPEGSIPYVKKWQNQVLLTYLPAESLDQIAYDRSQAY